jgi:DNA-binding FadR family transcriptional regulator
MTDISTFQPEPSSKRSADAHLAIRPIRKAFEQVADQLREAISVGVIANGERLPSEAELARQYGVSRPTLREALRMLDAQGLIRTAKGGAGGSFVTQPTVEGISGSLSSDITLLSERQGVTLEELLEARELIEVPAARLAAERANADDLEGIRGSIPEDANSLDTTQNFRFNRGFHSAVIESCGNRLLVISAQPVFSVLQTRLARSSLSREFHDSIRDQHVEISRAIDARAGDQAAALMLEHLRYLRPYYEIAWRDL